MYAQKKALVVSHGFIQAVVERSRVSSVQGLLVQDITQSGNPRENLWES